VVFSGLWYQRHCFDWRAQIWVSFPQRMFCTGWRKFLMYRSCAFSVSCFRARFSVRVASLRRCFDNGDLLVCQARRRRLFSRTSRSICRFVLKWLVCTSLPCGVEIVAASTSLRALVEQSMSASMLK